MKKTVAFLSLAALALSANIASARGLEIGSDLNARVDAKLSVPHKFDGEHNRDFVYPEKRNSNWFVVMGTVKSSANNVIVVDSDKSTTDVTVKTDADTKFKMHGKEIVFADIKAGQRVVVMGEKDSTTWTANWVHVKAERKMVFGQVTAKTDTSVTFKNNTTGNTVTVPVTDETMVKINGETKTAADIQVGDSGFVKIKAVLDTMVTKFIHLFR